MMISLPLMGIGALVQLGRYASQQKRHQQAVQHREHKYRELLQQHSQELMLARDRQERALRLVDPTPDDCLHRVSTMDPRLWERASTHADFLAIRLGVGSAPFSMSIKAPRETGLGDDPLVKEAISLATQFATVSGVPIQLPLRTVGVSGLVGPRSAVLGSVRSLAVQIATHHAPDEVKIVALFPEEEAEDWAWIRWLPHVWSDDRRLRLLAADKEGAHDLLTRLHDDLQRRKAQALAPGQDSKATHPLPVYTFILGDMRLLEKEPILPLLLTDGALLGAFTMICADRQESLPKECRAIASVKPGSGELTLLAPGLSHQQYLPDDTSADTAEQFSRSLAPIRQLQANAAAEIPATVTLLDLLDVTQVEDLNILQRWRFSEPYRTMAVPVGRTAGGIKVVLDLHEQAHGPHGLVAGATGSGKSETLQSFIAALSVSVHPHDLAFIIVDFKGGGMADAFRDLPHLVGTLTNLQGNLAKRAQSALKAELERRQRLLGAAGVTKIDDYIRLRRQGGELEPLPHLLLVVDEFAELTAQYPEFTKELLTSTVRVGRSLGVHLILAMQNPAGVVNDQIQSNTKFRLCLRMERPEDSRAVLKRDEAASITHRGRGYFQVGNNERFELFQSAWGGAPYISGALSVAEPASVSEVALNGRRFTVTQAPVPPDAATGATQMQALVKHIADQAARAGIQRLAGPWCPPMADSITLDQVRNPQQEWDGVTWQPSQTWLEPVLGHYDDPINQHQGPFRLNLGKEGHLVLYGSPGSGKTTFVQTLVTSLAMAHSPDQLHIYLVDALHGSLSLFKALPHVGGVISGEDSEPLRRLLQFLVHAVEIRQELFSQIGVNTLSAYRASGEASLPALVLVIDGLPTLAPDEDEMLGRLAREGRSRGVHLVLTVASSPGKLYKISKDIALALTLHQNEKSDYQAVLGRSESLGPELMPGRALIRGTPGVEIQFALPIAGSDWDRTAALRRLFQQMAQTWTGPPPRPIPRLPDQVELADLVNPAQAWASGALEHRIPVGLLVETLQPFTVDLQEGPHFVITGPPQTGKTTLLQSWLIALAAMKRPDQLELWLVDLGARGLAPLQRLPQVGSGYVADLIHLDRMIGHLTREIQERKLAIEEELVRSGGILDDPDFLARFPVLVIAIDDYDVMRAAAGSRTRELESMLRAERRIGIHFIVASPPGALAGMDPLDRTLRELQTGFGLGSTDHSQIGLRLSGAPQTLPVGMGLFQTRRSRTPLTFKAATAQDGGINLRQWVDTLATRATATLS